MNLVTSFVSARSAGVITLYDYSYECLQTFKGNDGRLAIVVIENEIEKFIVANVCYG